MGHLAIIRTPEIIHSSYSGSTTPSGMPPTEQASGLDSISTNLPKNTRSRPVLPFSKLAIETLDSWQVRTIPNTPRPPGCFSLLTLMLAFMVQQVTDIARSIHLDYCRPAAIVMRLHHIRANGIRKAGWHIREDASRSLRRPRGHAPPCQA